MAPPQLKKYPATLCARALKNVSVACAEFGAVNDFRATCGLGAENDATRETHDGVLALSDHVVRALEVGRVVYECRIILRKVDQMSRPARILHAGKVSPAIDSTLAKTES